MRSLFKIKKKESAGLFIDKGLYRYIALKGHPGAYEVTRAFSGMLPATVGPDGEPYVDPGKSLNQALKLIRGDVGDLGTSVNLSLPTSDSLLRTVPLPDMETEEARMAFRYDYERYFPFSVNEAVFDLAPVLYPLPTGNDEKRFIVASARKPFIDGIMDSAINNDLDIMALEPAQIALERAITPPVPLADAVVYVYAGKRRSVLILSWKGNGIFHRSIADSFEEGPTDFEKNTSEFTTEHMFVREIHSYLLFALSQIRGFEPETMVIFGPGSSEGLMTIFKDTVEIKSVIFSNPFEVHGIDFSSFDAGAGSWEIPLGLALRDL